MLHYFFFFDLTYPLSHPVLPCLGDLFQFDTIYRCGSPLSFSFVFLTFSTLFQFILEDYYFQASEVYGGLSKSTDGSGVSGTDVRAEVSGDP